MQNGLIIMQDGLPYLHPLLVILAFLSGDILGNALRYGGRLLYRITRPLSAVLYAIARRL